MRDETTIFELPTPASWTAWWAWFLPVLLIAVLYWVAGGAYSGWVLAGVVVLFSLLARGFADAHWKVAMRAGISLSVAALVVMFAAAFTVETPGTGKIGAWLYPMHRLGFVPLMLTGMGLCVAGGISALMGGADD